MNNQMLEQRLKSFTENFTKFREEFHNVVNEVQNNDIIFARSLEDSDVARLNAEIDRTEFQIEYDTRKINEGKMDEPERRRTEERIEYNKYLVEEKKSQLAEIEKQKKLKENENVERLKQYRERLQKAILEMKNSIQVINRNGKEISSVDHLKNIIDVQVADLEMLMVEKQKELYAKSGKEKEPVVKELQKMHAERERLKGLYNNLGYFIESLEKMEKKYVDSNRYVDVFDLFDSTKGFDYLFEELADSLQANNNSTLSVNVITNADGSYSLDMRCGNKFAEPRPLLGPNQLTKKNIDELLLGFAAVVAQKSSFSDDVLINGNVVVKANGVELGTVSFGEVGKTIETNGLTVSEPVEVKKTDGDVIEIAVEQPTVEVDLPVEEQVEEVAQVLEEVVEEVQPVEIVEQPVEEVTQAVEEKQETEEVVQTAEPVQEENVEEQVEEPAQDSEEMIEEVQPVVEETQVLEEAEPVQVDEQTLDAEIEEIQESQVVDADVLPEANHEKRDSLFRVRSARKAKHWTAAAVLGVSAGVLIGGVPAVVGGVLAPLAYDKTLDLWANIKNSVYTRKLKKLGERIGFDYVVDYDKGTACFKNKSNPNDILEQHELSSGAFIDEKTGKNVDVQKEIDKIFGNKYRGVINPQSAKELRMAGFEKVTVENLHVGFQDIGGIRPLDLKNAGKWMFSGINPKRYWELLTGKDTEKKEETVVSVDAELEQPSEEDVLAAQALESDTEQVVEEIEQPVDEKVESVENVQPEVAQVVETIENEEIVPQSVENVEETPEIAQPMEITDDQMEIVGNESIVRDIALHAGVQIAEQQDLTETETEGRRL